MDFNDLVLKKKVLIDLHYQWREKKIWGALRSYDRKNGDRRISFKKRKKKGPGSKNSPKPIGKPGNKQQRKATDEWEV